MFGGPGAQYSQYPPKKSGMGGMGAGGMMLGAGAGLVGGAMLMNAVDDHQDFEEQQAYQQGQGMSFYLFLLFLFCLMYFVF